MKITITHKLYIKTVILLAALGATCPLGAVAQEKHSLHGLIAASKAIVAVEILSTDYTATPADGPMIAVARVLKVLKGPLRKGRSLSFTETAWVGPTYREGEYRILFLEQNKSTEVPLKAPWRILSRMFAKEDFFIEEDVVQSLTLESLDAIPKRDVTVIQ